MNGLFGDVDMVICYDVSVVVCGYVKSLHGCIHRRGSGSMCECQCGSI